jgi:hypothetical protein
MAIRASRACSWGALASLFVLALPLAGCDATPALEEVRAGIESALPGIDLVPEANLHLGRFSLGFVHWVLGHDTEDGSRQAAVGEPGEPSEPAKPSEIVAGERGDADGARLVRAIDRLDLSTFRVRSMPPGGAEALSPDLARRLGAAGWSLVVHASQHGEQTWVFYRGGAGGAVSDLYVISLESQELCLLRLGGRFDEALAHALARQPRRVIPRGAAGAAAAAPAAVTAGGASVPGLSAGWR